MDIQELLRTRYFKPGERTWGDVVTRVVNQIKGGAGDFNLMYDKKFIPSSPVLMNAGAQYPMMCSCFVLPIADDIKEIMDCLHHTVMIQKWGGGVGINFSPIRADGSYIKGTGGRASGPVSFMQFWNTGMNVIRQGGKRQGAMMGVLNWDHDDLDLFLNAKSTEGELTNFNLSVGLDEGTPEGIIDKIAQHAWVNGEPGVLYLDVINRNNPYGITIEATNPCWSGETLVWTAHGPRTFGELASEGKDVQVLTQTQDGQLTFRTMRNPRRTGMMSVWELCLDNGAILRATGDHNVILKDGTKKMIKNLQPGDRLASVYRYKANSKGYLRLVNGTDEPLEHHVVAELVAGRRPNYPEEHCHHKDGNPTNNVPENLEILSAHEHNRMGMVGEDNPMAGVWDERNPLYGRDVSGENNPRYRSDITVEKVKALKEQGLTHQEVADRLGCSLKPVKGRWKLAQAQANHIVQWVRPTEETVSVYNGTVDETHTYFVLAGSEDEAILSANCGEVPLPPYGACCLGSMNLTAYVMDNGEFDYVGLLRDASQATSILNRVLDTTWWPIPEIAKFEEEYRPIGLGVFGLADTLIRMGIPYASAKGLDTAWHIMNVLRIGARRVRQDNATLLAIAPTGSVTMLGGSNSYSIEPLFALQATKNVELGSFTESSMESVEILANMFGYEMSDSDRDIINSTGSARETGMPNEMKEVLRTALEISPSYHLLMQATIQDRVDSAVSKTINMPANATVEDVKKIIVAGRDLGLKGLTIYRSTSREVEVFDCPTGVCDL